MPIRRVPLMKGEVYHIYSKSISELTIFKVDRDYEKMLDAMIFYSLNDPGGKLSLCKKGRVDLLKLFRDNSSDKLVDIIAYCLMPTHFHLILKDLQDRGITEFITHVLKSYSHYFNIKYQRKGPLWESQFKNVLIKDDNQLLHLTRYIHLNPVTAFLTTNPCDWKYSSYKEYLGLIPEKSKLTNFLSYLRFDKNYYERFVLDQIPYQRELAALKNITSEQKAYEPGS